MKFRCVFDDVTPNDVTPIWSIDGEEIVDDVYFKIRTTYNWALKYVYTEMRVVNFPTLSLAFSSHGTIFYSRENCI